MRELSDTIRDRLAILLAVVVVGLVLLVVGGTFVTVSSHNADLHKIYVLTQKTHQIDEQNYALKKQLDKDLAVVGQYAAMLATEITSFHGLSYADQQAICSAIPGCMLPSQSP